VGGQAPPSSGQISAHLTPGVQRLLDRLQGAPVAVFDAKWDFLAWNPLFAALHGDPGELPTKERNIAWLHFVGPLPRVRQTPEEWEQFGASLVGDLRTATGRYPTDAGLAHLIARLRVQSPEFARLWDSGVAGEHQSTRKTIEHPQVGPVTLDHDVLTVAGSDLRVLATSTVPGSADAEALALIGVLGTQQLA
jgi:PAS domain-containing protein